MILISIGGIILSLWGIYYSKSNFNEDKIYNIRFLIMSLLLLIGSVYFLIKELFL